VPKVESKTIKEIANAVDGELNSDSFASVVIDSIASSPDTSTLEDIVFIYEQKYLKNYANIKAKAAILPLAAKEKLPPLPIPVIWAKRPRLVMKKLLEFLKPSIYSPEKGKHSTSVIDSLAKVDNSVSLGANVFVGPSSKIGKNSVIYPNVFIGANIEIGENCIIYSNVSIYDYTKIGNNVIIHSNTVIGSDGYSYVTEDESNLEKIRKGDANLNFARQIQCKIPTIGNVIIEDDVEIGANSCVDRGTIGPTVIGAGSKVDNLVQVAHNCKIGKDCLIVGQVGFAGSVELGDRSIVGGQAGFADNLKLGNDIVILAKAGVHSDIPDRSVYMGMPAIPYMEHFKKDKAMKRLPRKTEKLEEQVKALEEKIKEMEVALTSLRGGSERADVAIS